LGGIGIGVSNALFGWITSGRFSAVAAGILLLMNIVVMMIPTDFDVFRKIAFALSNFIILSIWLTIQKENADLSR